MIDERVADAFAAPADDLERYHYAWSVVGCLPGAMGDPQTRATGAVMRVSTLRRYAADAGFRSVEVLPDRDTRVAVLPPAPLSSSATSLSPEDGLTAYYPSIFAMSALTALDIAVTS